MQYNHNKFKTLPSSKRNEIFETINALERQILNELVDNFRNKEPFVGAMPVNDRKVISLWNHYALFNTIMENRLKQLNDLIEDFNYIISYMWVITQLCGHSRWDLHHECEEEYGMDKEEYDSIVEWVDGFYISDYGFPALTELQAELHANDIPEHQLITLDRILNTWHGSGSLSDRFIQGGLTTLSKLANSNEMA